ERLQEDNAGALPDLIVLDVLLSGRDGRAICRTLKSREETRHVPIVMISAHPDAERSVREVGADAFVAKPFSVDHLLDTISSLIESASG
ncbi:MAG: response regulator, partial [Thermomicrobiales bacterium]|nr:response regulator [Thermomicrobiales bacterium]